MTLSILKSLKKIQREIKAATKAGDTAAALAAQKRLNEVIKGGVNSPLMPRAAPLSEAQIQAYAERMAPQIAGELTRKEKSAETLAGKSQKQFKREQTLPVERRVVEGAVDPMQPLPPMTLEQQKGSVLLGLPGDPSLARVELRGIGDVEFERPVTLHGGPRYGDDEKLWASNLSAASGLLGAAGRASQQYGNAPVIASYTKMPSGLPFAQHYLESLLQYQRPDLLSKEALEALEKDVRGGFVNAQGKRVTFPEFPGFGDMEGVLDAALQDSNLRKHLAGRLEKGEKYGLRPAEDVQFAVSHPELTNLETGASGFTLGELPLGQALTESAHPTYSHDIAGKVIGQLPHATPYDLLYRDQLELIRQNPRSPEFNTLKLLGARQNIDEQLVNEINEYQERVRRLIGKKKGGAVKKAEGGTVSYELPDDVTPQNWRDQLETNVLNDARALIGVKEGGPINLDRLLEKAVRKANGGPANLDDMLKWAVAKHNHKMKKGGEVSQTFPLKKDEEEERMFSPAPLKIPEPITEGIEALKRQFEKEKRSMSKPGAVQDVLMRGPVAMYAGAPADILGMGGEALDWLQTKIPGMRKPASVMDTGPEKVPPMGYAPVFPLTPDEPYGTEAARELMKQSGLTTGTERPLFETGAAVAAPFAGMAALKTGKALAPTAADIMDAQLQQMMSLGKAGERVASQAIPSIMERGGLGADLLSAMSRGTTSNVIKPEGGNWVRGATEKFLEDLRYDESLIDPVGVMSPADKAEEIARVTAMNNFVDKKLSRYFQNQMGTPSDPLRLQADTWAETQKKLLVDKDKQIDKVRSDIQKAQRERGVDPEVLTRSQARLRELQKERDLIKNRKGLHYEPLSTDVTVFGAERRRKDLGAPRERMAKSEIGQKWEDRSDLSVQQSSYMDQPQIGIPRTYDDIKNAAAGDKIVDKALLDSVNAALEKMGGKYALENPEALAYRTTGDPSKVGFDHMMDEIDNALRPSQGLPEYLQLKPKDLDKMSVAQVSEHVDKINAWRASQKAEVDAARAANAATVEHKAYDVVPGTDIPNDQGLRWVEIKAPEVTSPDQLTNPDAISKYKQYLSTAPDNPEVQQSALQRAAKIQNESFVEDALKYEGEILQHCVGGYCPDVLEGRSRIFSLRDADGRPHATIEVEPPEKLYAIGGEEYERLDPQTKGQYREYVRQWRQRNPDVDELTDEHVVEALKEAGVPPNPEKITQIKGLQNRKPNDEYMPFIQDFVKSGQWSEVGDLHNTGLFKVTQGQKLPGFAKEIPPGYYTLDDFQKMAVENEMPQEILDHWMNKLGGRRFFGMKRGGRVTKADLEQQFRMAFGGGVFNTDPDITDSGRIIPEHTI